MLTRLVRDTWSFSAAKNYQETRDLTLALKDTKGKLREFNEFKEVAESITDKYNQTWLRTEYDFAISASQSAARWSEFQREKDTIPLVQFQTVDDDNVRPEHQLLHGLILHIDDPRLDALWTPLAWGCRCEWIQSIGSISRASKEIPDVHIPEMFKTNLAKTGLIYPKNHPYYIDVPRAEISKSLAYLPPKNTFIDYDFNGVKLEVHPLHGAKELAENIDISKLLKTFDSEAKIKLMPILSEADMNARKLYYPKSYLDKYPTRNADALINGQMVEYETANGSKASIQNAIKSGKKQAEKVVIHLPDNMNMLEADRIVQGQLKHYQDKENLTVWLVNTSERKEYIIKQKQQ